jgi:phospholipase/lecithinase/hemolysin
MASNNTAAAAVRAGLLNSVTLAPVKLHSMVVKTVLQVHGRGGNQHAAHDNTPHKALYTLTHCTKIANLILHCRG